jgi:hypothetical protein
MNNTKKFVAIVLFFSMVICFYAQEGQEDTASGNALLIKWKLWKNITDNPNSTNLNSLDAFNAGFYIGFVSAAMDGLKVANLAEYPEGVNVGQGCRVVGKYLEDHPEFLHERNFVLVSKALMTAFPRKKKSP